MVSCVRYSAGRALPGQGVDIDVAVCGAGEADPLMGVMYRCADCDTLFSAPLALDASSNLGAVQQARCPTCVQLAGYGSVRCQICDHAFTSRLPHWHRSCDAFAATCPVCGEVNEKPCSCEPCVETLSGRRS